MSEVSGLVRHILLNIELDKVIKIKRLTSFCIANLMDKGKATISIKITMTNN